MKIIILLLGICFTLYLFISCSKSSPEIYWHNNPDGIFHVSPDAETWAIPVDTNDLNRLQKIVPFTIMLPKYFPEDGQNYYRFQMVFDQDITEWRVRIIYDNLKHKKEIQIDETQLDDYDLLLESYPGYFEELSKLNGGIVITLGGINIWERDMYRNVPPFWEYCWIQDNIRYTADIYGYDKNISRKIIESVIK